MDVAGSVNMRHLLADSLVDEFNQTINCTAPASDSFPEGVFTEEQRRSGYVAINIFITIYMFFTLAIVSHYFFVPAINKIAEVFKIAHNVVGASLMAAMASIPQLATSIIGVMVAKDDIGFGTVAGSSFFNILFTPGICALLVQKGLVLECWPMVRDCVAYIISVIILTIVVFDEIVHWYEAFAMILAYLVYLVVLAFNEPLSRWANSLMDKCHDKCSCCSFFRKEPDEDSEENTLVKSTDQCVGGQYQGTLDQPVMIRMEKEGSVSEVKSGMGSLKMEMNPTEQDEPDYPSSLLSPPSAWYWKIGWVFMLPSLLLLTLFIPDFRRCGNAVLPLTVFMSVVFIGAVSYILVWMISLIGDTFYISPTVMGMTLMAAGGSVPDMLNSVFSALDGHGDMAVANALGSNLFDVLFCLSVPWLVDYIAVDVHRNIRIYGDMTAVAMCLISSGVIIALVSVSNRWVIDRKMGVFLIVAYLAFIITNTYIAGSESLPLCK